MNILIELINAFVSLFRITVGIEFFWLYFACLIVVITTAMIIKFFVRGKIQ